MKTLCKSHAMYGYFSINDALVLLADNEGILGKLAKNIVLSVLQNYPLWWSGEKIPKCDDEKTDTHK